MTALVGWLCTALLERNELVAEIDEGCGIALASKLEGNNASVESQSSFDVTDLQSDMVETYGTCFL